MYWYYKVLFGILAVVLAVVLIIKFYPESEPSQEEEQSTDNTSAPINLNLTKNSTEIEKTLTKIDNLIKKRKLEDAYNLSYKEIKKEDKFSNRWHKLADKISMINRKILQSTYQSNRKMKYTVKYGDSLSKIAQNNKTTVMAIKLSNDIPLNSSNIRPNIELSFFSAPWKIEVSKKHYTLVLYHQDKIFLTYKVGIGKNNTTMQDSYEITDKVAYNLEKRYGARWIRIESDRYPRSYGFGIHGTDKADSIGKQESKGCIRMYNQDVKELYDLIINKTLVIIKE